MMDQLPALTRSVPGPFLFLARHADNRQFARIAIDIARKPLAEGGGVPWVGFYSGSLLVEFARSDDVAMSSGGEQLAVESEAEAARFINDVNAVPATQ